MKNKAFKILGLMSGTSMDGLDCCLCDLKIDNNYNFNYNILDWKTFKYDEKIKSLIKDSIANPKIIKTSNDILGKIFSKISHFFLNGRKIDLIGSHGQTIQHIDKQLTKQIGNPKFLFKSFNVPVVYNFREKDLLANGNGAPLMPYLDWLLFKNNKKDTFTLNIGGISNLCKISKNISRQEVIGFDSGPGMSLIDEFVNEVWNEPMDYNGKYSSKGKTIKELEKELLLHDYIIKEPPKSTGKEEFGLDLVKNIIKNYQSFSSEDILRTLVTFTAKSISINLIKYLKFKNRNFDFYINGGGVHHPILLDDIKYFTKIENFSELQLIGIHQDNKEALLIATLALSRFLNIPANMSKVTGSIGNFVLGDILLSEDLI